MITLQEQLDAVTTQYNIIGQICLDIWHETDVHRREQWLRNSLEQLRKEAFESNDRILLTLSKGDVYDNDSNVGDIIKTLQYQLDDVDITNCFITLITNQSNEDVELIKEWFLTNSHDTTEISIIQFDDPAPPAEKNKSKGAVYRYNSVIPVKISLDELTEREEFLLTQSKTFCIYPWVHIHAYPTGEAYPCCHAEMKPGVVGNCRTQTLEEIWQGEPMQRLRDDMLHERKNAACTRCYEQEEAGFFSGRRSANKHHGHHIKKLDANPFELTYWDIRFSNLCNLRCRSCGHIFSSQWYQDQAKLAGGDWKQHNAVLNYAGRTELDMWEQLEPHLDYVEQIYFAGGEPLLMEEHYRILDELVRRERFDVRLIYNTNFTHTDLKGKSVFEYWKKFKSVAVGASLDGMGKYGEYIRKGTEWATVEQNRRDMLAICPEVDFYISPTLSIMNAWHLPDFHRDWVDKGLIRAQDLNVNILQDPPHYRIDIAPVKYKQRLRVKYEEHIEWLRSQDPLQRATVGFESAINFMMSTDNTHLIDAFWRKTRELDAIRNEDCLTVIPELQALL